MDREIVKAALVTVLQEVQRLSGLECPPIRDSTKPVEDLPKFDSKVWPVAFGLVGIQLGVQVPVDVNIFRQAKTRIPNTIEQTVTAIIKALEPKPDASKAAPTNSASATAQVLEDAL